MFTETLMKLLVRCLVLLENHFTLTYCSNKFFVTFWKLICSLADTPHWLDDAKECIQSGWSKQRDCWSLTHEMLVASRKLFGGQHLDFQQIFDWIPREEASTFQFICCSIWKPGESNFWVKICLAQEGTLFDLLCCYKWILRNNTRNQRNI